MQMKLSAELSPDPWRAVFEQRDRVQVPDILSLESARKIHQCLSKQEKWNLVFNRDGKHTDIDADSEVLWNDSQKQDFLNLVHSQATNDFQYLYKAVPIYDIYHKNLLPGHFLNKVFEFLNGEAFLNFVREVLSMPEIGFADAQATCYSAGHFLTSHDDNVQGKNRLAAYVLNLTPDWNANWGGALQFINSGGDIEAAYSPSYNALNMFRVPQQHSVAYVTPFAGAQRYSITGWLRAGKDPMGSN